MSVLEEYEEEVRQAAGIEDDCDLPLDIPAWMYVGAPVGMLLVIAGTIYLLEELNLIPRLQFSGTGFWDPNPSHQVIWLIIGLGFALGLAFAVVVFAVNWKRKQCWASALKSTELLEDSRKLS